MQRLAAFGAGLLMALLGGCSATSLRDRLSDATDFLHVEALWMSAGLVANVGPLTLGALCGSDEPTVQFELGPGGGAWRNVGGSIVGLLYPFCLAETRSERRAGYPNEHRPLEPPPYRRWDPALASIGIDIGWGFGFGLRFDLAEFGDFLLGFVALDPVGDDWREPPRDTPLPPEKLAPIP